jgi:hypothetical protein
MSRNFGLSNIYLKIGLVLVVISLLILAVAVLAPSRPSYVSSAVAGYCFVSGAVLYIIGRVAAIRRSRAQA